MPPDFPNILDTPPAGFGGLTIFQKDSSQQVIVSSTAEETLYTILAPTGTFPADGDGLRMEIGGLFFNGTGGNVNFTLRVNRSVILAQFDLFNPLADSVPSYFWRVKLTTQRFSATAMRTQAEMFFDAGAAGAGFGDYAVTPIGVWNNGSTIPGGVDIGTSLLITGQMSVNSALANFITRWLLVEQF